MEPFFLFLPRVIEILPLDSYF